MTERELLIGFLTKSLNKTETELQSMLFDVNEKGEIAGIKEGADQVLYEQEAARTKAWKDKITATASSVANEKTAQINGAWESRIKETFGITDDLKGDDLFVKVSDTYKTASAGTGKGKNSAEYLELEGKHKQLQNTYASLEQAMKTDYVPRTEIERLNRMAAADNYVMSVFNGMKLVKDDDATIEETKMANFKRDLMSQFDDITRTDDGKYYGMKDGKRIENEFGHGVELSEHVKAMTRKYWKEAKQDPKGNGGNNNNAAGGGVGKLAELEAKMNRPGIPAAELYQLSLEYEQEKLNAARK